MHIYLNTASIEKLTTVGVKFYSPPPKFADFESSTTSLIQYIERSSFFVLKIWSASVGRRQIKVDLAKFSLSCSRPKSCTFHKHFLDAKIATEALLLAQ